MLILYAFVLFTSLPLSNYYLFEFKGHELHFHLLRIEGIMERIQVHLFYHSGLIDKQRK